MTVASLCNDILVLAVFLLVGFFVRELCKPLQKLFLPSSLRFPRASAPSPAL